jgi:hypothetical protein
MQISQTTEQIAALKSLQDRCELENISLLSCNANRAKAGIQFSEPFSVKPVLSNVSNFQQGEQFVVEVAFEYAAWDSSEPPQRIFLVTCSFEVCYRVRDAYAPTEDERHSFSRGTAVFNCWPYAREFFRDITARLGHPTPALPLLRIMPKKSEPTPKPPESVPAVSVSHPKLKK